MLEHGLYLFIIYTVISMHIGDQRKQSTIGLGLCLGTALSMTHLWLCTTTDVLLEIGVAQALPIALPAHCTTQHYVCRTMLCPNYANRKCC